MFIQKQKEAKKEAKKEREQNILIKIEGFAGNRTRATCTRNRYFTTELRSHIRQIEEQY